MLTFVWMFSSCSVREHRRCGRCKEEIWSTQFWRDFYRHDLLYHISDSTFSHTHIAALCANMKDELNVTDLIFSFNRFVTVWSVCLFSLASNLFCSSRQNTFHGSQPYDNRVKADNYECKIWAAKHLWPLFCCWNSFCSHLTFNFSCLEALGHVCTHTHTHRFIKPSSVK